MKNSQVLEVLDSIDEFLKNNLNDYNKLNNPKGTFPTMYIDTLESIMQELNKRDFVEEIINQRILCTYNALLYASDQGNLMEDNDYFNWINYNKYIKTIDEDQLYYDVRTGHNCPFEVSFIKKELGDDNPSIGTLIDSVEEVQQQYDSFLAYDKNQQNTQLAVKKNSPFKWVFDKIAKFINKFKSNKESKQMDDTKHIDNTNIHNTLDSIKVPYTPTVTSPKEQPEQVIAISDLHGDMNKWNAIKQYMKTNPNMKLVILGDAMDRGDYGLEILLQIKELSDQGKAKYLPGNHDSFAYNYVQSKTILDNLSDQQKSSNPDLVLNLENIKNINYNTLSYNGGEPTINSLENFDAVVQKELNSGHIYKNITKEELMNWLGSQPIQEKTNIAGTNYALAHAWFDDELYNYDKDFNLNKALSLEAQGQTQDYIYKKFTTVMWYREKNKDDFLPVNFPTGYNMIIGHTPQKDGINLTNFYDSSEYAAILYIDNESSALDLTNGTNIPLFEDTTHSDR